MKRMKYYLITILMLVCCFTCAQVKIRIVSFNENEMVLFKKAPAPQEGKITMGEPPKDITITLIRIVE